MLQNQGVQFERTMMLPCYQANTPTKGAHGILIYLKLNMAGTLPNTMQLVHLYIGSSKPRSRNSSLRNRLHLLCKIRTRKFTTSVTYIHLAISKSHS